MADQPTSIDASPKALLGASAAALAIAGATLVLFVLPAEAGIDPTGVGRAIGLAQMAAFEAEDADAQFPATPAAAPEQGAAEVPVQTKANIAKATALRSDEMTIELPAHSDIEVKANMVKGDGFVFRWEAKGGPVKVDMHGEPPNGGPNDFTSYWEEAAQTEAQGVFVAPFTGTQGWYWRNKGEVPVTVTVRTTGFYKDLVKKGG